MKPKWHLDGPAEERAAPAAPAKDKAAQMERGLEAANVSGSLTVISFYVKGGGDSWGNIYFQVKVLWGHHAHKFLTISIYG